MSRADIIAAFRACGWHHDTRGFTTLYAQNSVLLLVAMDAFEAGIQYRAAGHPCPCASCVASKERGEK